MAIKTLRASLGLLATRRFGTFWVASLLSSVGTWTQQVAEPWLLLTLGASSFVIGLDSFAVTAPVWLLSIVGGGIADHGNRRRVIARLQSIQMLCPILIVVLMATGQIRAWMIIALSVVVGVTDALSMPSFQSIVPSIVEHDQIGLGLALSSTQFNLSRVIGPSVAGVLMSSVGAQACFAVSALSYVPLIAAALWILPRSAARASTALRSSFDEAIVIIREPPVRNALRIVLTTSGLCAPLVIFSPVLVRNVFQGTAGQFSGTVAAFGAGGLIGAAGLLAIGPGVDRRRVSASFAAAYGAILILTALNHWAWALPVLFVCAGIVTAISNTSANTLLQTTARPDRLGETVGLYILAISAGNSLGAILTGLSVSTLGVRTALFINGAATILALIDLVRPRPSAVQAATFAPDTAAVG